MQRVHTWIVGIDLSERCRGAIAFARWLRECSAADERMRGVYVGATDGSTHAAMRDAVDAQTAAPAFESIDTIRGEAPEDELRRVAAARDVTGVIVGRNAETSGWSLVSLGRVARRLLREVSRPIAVVPPDFEPASGPIIVAVVPDEHAAGAVRLGRELAACLDLPLVLVHVVPDVPRFAVAGPMAYDQPPVPPERDRQAATATLRTWLDAHGFGDLELRTVPGSVGPTLLELADEMHASMILSGSRHLSLRERILQSSTGSYLAAHARQPVIVVPPSEYRHAIAG
jgi:nucleotide-binding universal stress UspA family protein